MKNKINFLFVLLLIGLLVFNMAITPDSNSHNNFGFSALIQSASADTESGGSTKYLKTYCSCSKGTGMDWTWCNMKTDCVASEFGNLDSCTSTSCNPGCSC